jgi:hypothetical protein
MESPGDAETTAMLIDPGRDGDSQQGGKNQLNPWIGRLVKIQ